MDTASARSETERIAGKLFSRFLQTLEDTDIELNWQKLSESALVDWESVKEGGTSIDLQQYYDLLGLVAPRFRDSAFYLRLGSAYDITDLGVLGYALLCAENLHRSWELTFHSSSMLFHPLNSRRWVEEGRVMVELATVSSPGAMRYAQEEWFAGTWKWLCQRLPQVAQSADLSLQLNYPEPAYADEYSDVFPGSISFGAARTLMSFPETWYELPLPSSNPITASACQQQSLLIMQQLEKRADIVQQVRRHLLFSAPRQFPSQQEMADQFNLQPHTFHRRLKKAGVSYQQIVVEMRIELAKDYLENTTLHLQEISYLLGYEHPPSFFRAFKNWVGMTPIEYRESLSPPGIGQ